MLPAVVFAPASWIVKVAIELAGGDVAKSKLICQRLMSISVEKLLVKISDPDSCLTNQLWYYFVCK